MIRKASPAKSIFPLPAIRLGWAIALSAFAPGIFPCEAHSAEMTMRIRFHVPDAYASAFGGLYVYGSASSAREPRLKSNLSWTKGLAAKRVDRDLFEVEIAPLAADSELAFKPALPRVGGGIAWANEPGDAGNYRLSVARKVVGEKTDGFPLEPYFDVSTARTPADFGALSDYRVRSDTLGEDRDLVVYTPPRYSPDEAVDVIYANDAQNLFTRSTAPENQRVNLDTILDTLHAIGAIRRTIVVGIVTSANRNRDLTPGNDPSAERAAGGPGGGAVRYLRFLTDELRPWVESHFRVPAMTSPNSAARTSIFGSSLGGFFALFAALERPDVFGRFGAFSASFQLNATPLAQRAGKSWRDLHPFLLDELRARIALGRRPSIRGTLSVARTSADGEANTRNAVDALADLGIRADADYRFLTFDAKGPMPAAHNELSWRRPYTFALLESVGIDRREEDARWERERPPVGYGSVERPENPRFPEIWETR